MRRNWKRALVVLVAILLAFGIGIAVGRSTAPEPSGSGIQGTVTFGGCVGGGARCSFAGQRACQRVLENTNGYAFDGALVTRFCSAEDGKYRISLPPGKYTIGPDERQVGQGLLKPFGGVNVRSGGFTLVDISYDNGMR